MVSNFVFSSLNYILQAIRLKYLHPDSELQQYALQVMEMLRSDTSVDAHALVFVSQNFHICSQKLHICFLIFLVSRMFDEEIMLCCFFIVFFWQSGIYIKHRESWSGTWLSSSYSFDFFVCCSAIWRFNSILQFVFVVKEFVSVFAI